MAFVALMTLTATAICASGSFDRAMKLNSPGPRQVRLGVEQGVLVPVVKRGSKAQARPGATGVGEVTVCVVGPLPPMSSNVSVGVIVFEVERFWTTMVLTRCAEPPFFAAYGPYSTVTSLALPSKETNLAVTFASLAPRFWTITGVTYPKNRRTMFGRNTLCAPEPTPTYESASARAPLPACSLTTDTTV